MRINMNETQAKAIMDALDERLNRQPGPYETNGNPPESFYFWDKVAAWWAHELETRDIATYNFVKEDRELLP